jgi:hypothetical protein
MRGTVPSRRHSPDLIHPQQWTDFSTLPAQAMPELLACGIKKQAFTLKITHWPP